MNGDKPVKIVLSWSDCFKFWLAGFIFILFTAIVSALIGLL
jgi:hypothetical protein